MTCQTIAKPSHYDNVDYQRIASVMEDPTTCPHLKECVYDDINEKTNGFTNFADLYEERNVFSSLPKESIKNLATIYVEGLDAKEKIKQYREEKTNFRVSFFGDLLLSQWLIFNSVIYTYFFTRYSIPFGVMSGIVAVAAIKVSIAAAKAFYNHCIKI